jgi:dipeptidyl-peptidase-4
MAMSRGTSWLMVTASLALDAMLPNQRHPYRAEAGSYMTRRRWDYFVRHLLDAEPPHEYELHSRTAGAGEDE